MGTKLSIDKIVSELEDILAIDPTFFRRIRFLNRNPSGIAHHLKLWRFYENPADKTKVCSEAISLDRIKTTGFTFKDYEAYLVLLIYRRNSLEGDVLDSLPSSTAQLIESFACLTPRGLKVPVLSSESLQRVNRQIIDCGHPAAEGTGADEQLEYLTFVWNGKSIDPIVKTVAMNKAFELENYIKSTQGPFLEVLFSGGIFKDNRLRTGSILQLIRNQNRQVKNNHQLTNIQDKVFLFKFLFPMKSQGGSQASTSPGFDNFKGQDSEYLQWLHSKVSHEQKKQSKVSSKRGSDGQHEGERGAAPMSSRDSKHDGFQSDRDYNFRRGGNTAGAGNQPNIPNISIGGLKLGAQVGRQGSQGVNGMGLGQMAPLSSSRGQESDDSREGGSNARPGYNPPMTARPNIPSLGMPGLQLGSLGNKAARPEPPKLAIPRIGGEQGLFSLGIGGGSVSGGIPKLDFQKLKYKGREEYGLKQMQDEERTGDLNMDIPESERKAFKMNFYEKQISEIIPKFMYLGGYRIASDLETLKEYEITNILNCAGYHTPNVFADSLDYKTYFLNDNEYQNIESVFYDAIEYINQVKQNNGRVYIHCARGVSRSAAVVLAYLMATEKMTFDEAFTHVKKARGIVSPNLGFISQLTSFYRRISDGPSKASFPRVFGIGSIQPEDPMTLVAKYLNDEPFYTGPNKLKLDPRGAFIIADQHACYLWLGSQMLETCQSHYKKFGLEYIKKLQGYEHFSSNLSVITQGAEPEEFWKVFTVQDLAHRTPEEKYGFNKIAQKWYLEMNNPPPYIPAPLQMSSRSPQDAEELDEHGESNKETRPAGYLFPHSFEPQFVLDFDDLQPDAFMIICSRDRHKVYIWSGSQFSSDSEEVKLFEEDVICDYFGEEGLQTVQVQYETPHEESEEFQSLF